MSRILSFLIGVALLCGCAYFTQQTIHLKRTGATALGIVVDQKTETSWKVSPTSFDFSVRFAPVVEFTPDAGSPVTFRSDLWSAWPKTIGQKVVVLYDRNHPDSARINGFWENWLVSIALGVLGVYFLLSAFGFVEGPQAGDDDDDDFSISWKGRRTD